MPPGSPRVCPVGPQHRKVAVDRLWIFDGKSGAVFKEVVDVADRAVEQPQVGDPVTYGAAYRRLGDPPATDGVEGRGEADFCFVQVGYVVHERKGMPGAHESQTGAGTHGADGRVHHL